MDLSVCLIKGEEVVLKDKVIGSFKNQVLSFKLEDMDNIIDLNKGLFIRENDEYQFYLDFLNKSCILTLKNENYSLDINVDKCSIEYVDNKVTINYFIDTDDSNNCFKIEWNDGNGFT